MYPSRDRPAIELLPDLLIPRTGVRAQTKRTGAAVKNESSSRRPWRWCLRRQPLDSASLQWPLVTERARPSSDTRPQLEHPRAAAPSVPCALLGEDAQVSIQTRRAAATDLERASEVLGSAFSAYPWTQWTVDPIDHRARITALQRLALEELGLPYGQVWITTKDEAICSVAVAMDSEVEIPEAVQSRVDTECASLMGSRHSAAVMAETELKDLRPSGHHVLLATIGTTPGLAGRGLGSRTLRAVLQGADRTATPVYLETSSERNLAFYERFGFSIATRRVVGEDGRLSGR